MDGAAARPAQGWQHRALASIACFWIVVASQAVLSALHSDWPLPPELPTAEQVHAARTAAWSAAAVAVTPLVGGVVLAGRWRMYEWAIGFGVVLMFAVLGSAMLLWLTDSPVRPG